MVVVERATIKELTNTITITFDRSFDSVPLFAYAIQNIIFKQSSVSIPYSIISSEMAFFTVVFEVLTDTYQVHQNDQIDLVLVFSNYPRVEIGTIITMDSHCNVQYINQHKVNSNFSYSLTIFILSIPATWTIQQKASNKFEVLLNANSQLPIVFSYILVQKIFISSQIYFIFDLILQTQIDYIIDNDQGNRVKPSKNNSFMGLMKINYTTPHLKLKQITIYEYIDQNNNQPAMKLQYISNGTKISELQGAAIDFNTADAYECPAKNQFLAYSTPFTTAPQACKPCDITCQTCTSSENDSTFTNSSYCLTCPNNRYLQPLSNADYGKCICLTGVTSENGTCLPCKFACLSFTVALMQSSTKAIFLLIFSEAYVQFIMDIEDNLIVVINGKKISYIVDEGSSGSYIVTLASKDFIVCSVKCVINFQFLHPQYVKYKNRYLVERQKSISVSNFYIIQDQLPRNLKQYFSIVSIMIIISSNSQTSLIKMLFELEQIIDVHKYLLLEIPVIFKQFVQSLVYFRFMDITAVLKFNVNQAITSICQNQLDNKGSPKIIFYESGANFYKNIMQVVISVALIICMNLVIYFIIRVIPWKLARKLSAKIKVRTIITANDLVESIVLPTSLFAVFQFSYVIWQTDYIWVYLLVYIFMIPILLFPFFIVAYVVYRMRKASKIEIEIYEDLMNDCKIHGRMAYIFYLYSFHKKLIFGLFLASNISGKIQILTLLSLNSIQLGLVCYMIKYKIFNSRVKIITRTLNLVSVITIQALILAYNAAENSVESMILIGVSCTYLAVVITVISMLQIVFKCFEILLQKIKKSRRRKLVNSSDESNICMNNNNQQIRCSSNTKNIIRNYQENSNNQPSSQQQQSQSQQKQQQQQQQKQEGSYNERESNPRTKTIRTIDTSITPIDFEASHNFSQIKRAYSQIIYQNPDSSEILREGGSKQLFRSSGSYKRQNGLLRNAAQNKIERIEEEPELKGEQNLMEIDKQIKVQKSIQEKQKKNESIIQIQGVHKIKRKRKRKMKNVGKNNKNNLLIFPHGGSGKQETNNQSSIAENSNIQQ